MTKMTMVTTMKSWTIYWKSISRLCVKTNALYLIGGENDDLIQEGMIGLFKAVRDYKSDKEASFYSFAQLCITRQLSSALEASNRKKHMPLNTYISFSQSDSDGTEFEEMLQDDIASPEQLLIEKEKFKEFKEQLWNKLSNMEKKCYNCIWKEIIIHR